MGNREPAVFKARDKQHAMRLLDALTTAELAVEARVGKKVNRLHGLIWARVQLST